jgi:hypothetical protein
MKALLQWLATVGTVLVLGDDLLAFYKTLEFRDAISSKSDLVLILTMYAVVGASAALILLAQLVRIPKLFPARTLAVVFCLISGICAAAILLLNMTTLPEWPSRALDGRNASAAWCLCLAVLYFVRFTRSRE